MTALSMPGLWSVGLAYRWLFMVLLLLPGVPTAWAHKAGDAYLAFASASAPGTKPGTVKAELSMALRDVDAALESLDADGDRRIRWGEVQSALPEMMQWLSRGVRLQCGDDALDVTWQLVGPERRSEGVFLRFQADVYCPAERTLAMRYGLMKGIDASHRLIVSADAAAGIGALAAVLSEDSDRLVMRDGGRASGDENTRTAGLGALINFAGEGMRHLASGADHLAFLLALLLPLKAQPPFSRGSPGRAALWRMAGLITAFTLGHAFSLMAAVLFGLEPPPWVEPAIALSVLCGAALNLVRTPGWLQPGLALLFGLVHGLAFSEAIAQARPAPSLLPWALAGFNLGVEAGQLALLGLWCALQWRLSSWSWHGAVVVRGGSLSLCLVALFWFFQRTAGAGS